MRRATLSIFALLAATSLAPLAALGEAIPVDLTVGYRFLDVTGNEDMYRSQIDEKAGFMIRGLSISGGDFGGKATDIVDHWRFDAADLGAGPANLARLEVGRTGYYNLRASYRRMDQFSALPAFANPLMDKGSDVSQHTLERTRTMVDAELELFPGRAITPIIGYTYNNYTGDGTTTYRLGENEFQMVQNQDEKDQEFRLGASFGFGPVSGSIVQGWRKFEGNETSWLMPGKNNGNYEGTILQLNDPADRISRTATTDVNTPVTNAFVTGLFGPVRLSAGYVYTHGVSDTGGAESSAGSFASYEIARFFKGLNETVSSNADAKYQRWNFRGDVALVKDVNLTFGYRRGQQQVAGMALINDLYLQTITYHGLDLKDITVLLKTKNWTDRVDEVMDAGLTVNALGPFSVRVAYSGTNQDLTITEDVAEIVLPGGQGGIFTRSIDRFEGGLNFHVTGFDLGGEIRTEKANDAVMRTDFIDRTTYKGRASIVPAEWFRVSGQIEETRYSNDRPGVGLDGKSTSYGIDAELNAGKFLTIRAGGAQYKADSTIPVRRPQDFVVETSVYSENGSSFQGGITFRVPSITLDGSMTHYRNTGTMPLVIDRARVRAELEFTKAVSLVGEWDHDEYKENDRSWGSLADYNANRYGLYVRFKQ